MNPKELEIYLEKHKELSWGKFFDAIRPWFDAVLSKLIGNGIDPASGIGNYQLRIVVKKQFDSDLQNFRERIQNELGDDVFVDEASFQLIQKAIKSYGERNIEITIQQFVARVPDENLRDELGRSIIAAQDATQMEQARRRINRTGTTYDAVTGIGDRAACDREVPAELEKAKQHSYPVAYLMLDLDGFKPINESHGHPVGDQYLRHVGNEINRQVGKRGRCFRFGGDEFLIFLPQTLPDEAEILGNRLIQEIEKIKVEPFGATLSASIGIACFPSHGNDHQVILKASDDELGNVKHNLGKGKASIAPYTNVLQDQTTRLRPQTQKALKNLQAELNFNLTVADKPSAKNIGCLMATKQFDGITWGDYSDLSQDFTKQIFELYRQIKQANTLVEAWSKIPIPNTAAMAQNAAIKAVMELQTPIASCMASIGELLKSASTPKTR